MSARNLFSRRCQWLILSLSLSSLSPVRALPAVEMNSASNFPNELAVTAGIIRGRALSSGEGVVFKGIPFAQPPVGELRWREPRPVVSWEGIREATESGPPAAQASFGWNDHFARASSEDCLYLDVWTPAKLTSDRLPVMIWIHGGSNLAGAGGADRLYQGGHIIRHGVIIVVIEYRVGAFGFFAHPELTHESPHHSSGNYGLLDQIAALRWVRENIAKFGGDPNNVTLFGQSAGSMDIMSLITSPLARGLFQRAIAESGPAPFGGMTGTLTEAEHAGEETAAELKAPKENTLAYLRSLPAETLIQAKAKVLPLCVDGWILPTIPSSAFLAGKETAIPLLLGGNAIEFPWGGSSIPEMRKTASGIFRQLTPKAFTVYGLDAAGTAISDPLYGTKAEQLGSDVFRCASIIQGEAHETAGNSVWEYEFARPIPGHNQVAHSGEIPYVFGNFHPAGDLSGNFTGQDRKLSATMQAYWTNFAKTGNPNGPGLPEWPAFNGKTRSYLQFTAEAGVSTGENQRASYTELYRELLRTP